MAEIYLDPIIIIIATIIIMGMIAFFDFLPYKKTVQVKTSQSNDAARIASV